MKILAIDLAWIGDTGWVLWNWERGWLLEHGTITIRDVPLKERKDKAYRDLNIARQLNHQLHRLIFPGLGLDLIIYEYSDWQRNLGASSEWKKEYAIERKAQRTLGMAEATFLLAYRTATMDREVPLLALGAREAKHSFGAIRKKACAELLAQEYPDQFRFERQAKNGWLWYGEELLASHISDAIVLAKVGGDKFALEKRQSD